MTRPTVLRRVVTDDALAPFRQIKTQYCVPGCVFHYWVGRNAYHGSWSSTYPMESAFFSTRERLLSAIERQRCQGSTFWYAELPAIVLKRGRHSLLLIQPNSWEPFANYVDQEADDLSLGALADAVWRGCKGAEILEQTPAQTKGECSYTSFKSMPDGADRPLYWSRSGQSYKLTEFNRMIQGLNEALRTVAV